MTRVLLITPGHDDFLIDGLLHGLRELLGDDAVEMPRADHLYKSYPAERRQRLHGLGFVFSDVLADDAKVDRDRALYRAVTGEYDLVIFGDIWRCFGQWVQWMPKLRKAGIPMAVIDSSDRVEPYPFAGEWWRTRVWWTLPRIRRRATYFKREMSRWTGWFRTYLLLPPPLAPRVRAKPISFGLPAALITTKAPKKTKDFPVHIVDPEVAERLGASTAYAFDSAAEYRADLERARFGVTTKKAGWDALRHYEIAAAGAVPCFRDLNSKPDGAAPHGLVDGENCITYADADELLARVAALSPAEYERLRAGALAWIADNTTVALAERVLRESGIAV